MKPLSFILALVFLFSCGETNTKEEKRVNESPSASETEVTTTPSTSTIEADNQAVLPENWTIQDIKGYYVGSFEASKYHEKKDYSYSNKINISIDELDNGKVEGHSVVAGNNRPFSGSYKQTEKGILILAREPGDDRYDGRFDFTVNPVEQTVEGIWVANDGKLAVYEREYKLARRDFAYDPEQELPEDLGWADLYSSATSRAQGADEGEFLTEDVLKVNASLKALKKEDIANMYKGDLEIIRNSIYARHGYSFKNRKIRYIFDQYVDWYMPVSTDVRDKLTDIEKANADLLKRYEQHASVYYDSYGR